MIPNRDPLDINNSHWSKHLWQPLRFVIVGIFNTGFSYAVYFLLLRLGVSFWFANLIALIFGICVGFVSQGSLVFMNVGVRRFGRFLIAWLTIYLVQTGVIGLLIGRGYSASLSGIVVLPGTVIVSYVVQKYFVFGAPERNTSDKSAGPKI